MNFAAPGRRRDPLLVIYRGAATQGVRSTAAQPVIGASVIRERAERGQVLVIGLFVCVGLMLLAVTVANIGMMVAEKIKLQDTVDAAAYSSAVAEARYMNLSAYINRAMIANYNNMAFNTALWALTDSYDHGMAVIVALLYQIDAILIAFPITTALGIDLDTFIDLMRDFVHHPLHTLNHFVDDLFAQDDDAQDLNQYLELFNIDLWTVYHGLLYAAVQSTRYEIQQKVAAKMDPEVLTTTVLGLGAETLNYDELAKAADYVIRDPNARGGLFGSFNDAFDKMHGEAENTDDHPLLLAATTEASLDKFAAGRTRDGDPDLLRQFNLGNIIPGVDAIETVVDVACEIATLGFGDCDSDITLTIGAAMRDGKENMASETHVPFIARQRMREVNFFGLDFNISGFPGAGFLDSLLGSKGHTSGEKNNDIGNVANTTFGLDNTDIDLERAVQTVIDQGFCSIGSPIPTCGLNSMNIIEASLMIAPPLLPPLVVDDHWDGSFRDIEPVYSYELVPPGPGIAEVVEYVAEVASEGTEDGVPKYDWQVDIDNVGFPLYTYPDVGERRPDGSSGGGGDLNKFSGPSVAVIGVKKATDVNGLRGLNMGNTYNLSAMARAQVYYLRNPKRPEERPSMFNPHWVARLAPIDSEDTPEFLSEGLPFLSSFGLGVKPTH